MALELGALARNPAAACRTPAPSLGKELRRAKSEKPVEARLRTVLHAVTWANRGSPWRSFSKLPTQLSGTRSFALAVPLAPLLLRSGGGRRSRCRAQALSPEVQETLAKAAARSKARNTARSTAPPFDPAEEPGVTAPLGFFDPAGFCSGIDKIKFRQLRTSELKHGRIAMLAAIGLVGQHYLRFPLAVFDELPNGIGAAFEVPGQIGIFTLFGVALLPEFSTPDASKEVGDFGDPLNFQMLTFGADLSELRNRELNNGRFAMFATLGILAAELATGKDAVEQLGLA
ncbi:LHCSR3.1 [Symbiodinium necroappetens]|uniref:LHCSR3.1 protein n=1 Tax=Symbiodinium necroappetens TaxID=1628268 RepID=A0A813ALJ6_9DINO|nr:LHCSR3.1 [Symbiodinium necroappetens]